MPRVPAGEAQAPPVLMREAQAPPVPEGEAHPPQMPQWEAQAPPVPVTVPELEKRAAPAREHAPEPALHLLPESQAESPWLVRGWSASDPARRGRSARLLAMIAPPRAPRVKRPRTRG